MRISEIAGMLYDSISVFIAAINSALKSQSVCIWRKRSCFKALIIEEAKKSKTKKTLIYRLPCCLFPFFLLYLFFVSGECGMQTLLRTLYINSSDEMKLKELSSAVATSAFSRMLRILGGGQHQQT